MSFGHHKGDWTRRRYAQYCSLARALDVIGERWTLLIVRELLVGPKRFRDLEGALLGMGANLLVTRLRQLQMQGVVERVTLPSPARVPVYQLTSRGRELETAVVSLAKWGIPELGDYRRGEIVRPDWLVVVLKARFDSRAATKIDETYEFHISSNGEEDVVHAHVRRGTLETRVGPAPQPDLTLSMDVKTYIAIAAGQLGAEGATAGVRVVGNRAALRRCRAVFGFGARRGS